MKFEENTESDILCPTCVPPRKLVVKTNKLNGGQFLGCPNYPNCNHTRGIPEAWIMRAQGQTGLFDELENEKNETTPQPTKAPRSLSHN